MPEEDPDIIPPEGYYEPVRGFGKVWCEEPGVREHLGWATGKAFVVGEGAYQYRLAGKYSPLHHRAGWRGLRSSSRGFRMVHLDWTHTDTLRV